MTSLMVQTSDAVLFEVPVEACKYSLLLDSMCDDVYQNEVPLPCVPSNVLTLILQFIHLYRDTPFVLVKPFPRSQYKKLVPPAHRAYLDQFTAPNGSLLPLFYDTLNGANYLGVEILLGLMCAFLAQLLSCKTADEIKTLLAYFGLVV